MNKTFKIIFNRIQGKYVVVSELARSVSKGSLKAITAIAVAASLGMVSNGAVAGDITVNLDIEESNNGRIISSSATVSGTDIAADAAVQAQINSQIQAAVTDGVDLTGYAKTEDVEAVETTATNAANAASAAQTIANEAKEIAESARTDAAASAEAAAASATSASESAGAAATSAQTATDKASAAEQSADEAHQDFTEAKAVADQAMSDAADAKADAGTAKTVAEEAQGTANQVKAKVGEVSNGSYVSADSTFGENINELDKTLYEKTRYFKVNSTEDDASATGLNAIAIGPKTVASGEQSISVGYGNVVSGSHAGAFGDPNTVSGDNSYAFGNNNTVSGTSSFAIGNENQVGGSDNFVFGNKVNVGSGISNVVVLGSGSTAVSNAVSVGAKGKERKIVNVAPGRIAADSTDAVNGSQLWDTNQRIDGMGSDIRRLEKRDFELDRKINRTGAHAAALAALHPLGLDDEHKFSVAAAYGQYHGYGAAAVGAFYQPTENVMVNAFAKKLDVSPATIHRLVTEKSAISPEMAIRLSMTIGQSARLWMQRQAEYDLWYVRQNGHVGKLPDLRA